MKRILVFSILIAAIVIVYGYRQSELNTVSEGKVDKASQEVTTYKESITSEKANSSKPQIMFIFSGEKGQGKWSPSLWWSYQHASPESAGC